MAVTFFPGTDAKLLAWSLNFSTLITAGPTTYGLTTAQASTYRNLHNAYATALAACDPSMRTKSAVATKNTARNNLKANARLLANLVNGTASEGQRGQGHQRSAADGIRAPQRSRQPLWPFLKIDAHWHSR